MARGVPKEVVGGRRMRLWVVGMMLAGAWRPPQERWQGRLKRRPKRLGQQKLSLAEEVDVIVGRLGGESSVEEVEDALLKLRLKDARRADMPEALRFGFARVFEWRAEKNSSDWSALAGLAALEADHERWEEVAEACEEAAARGSSVPFLEALYLRARRSTWDWREGDADLGRELADKDAISAFAALSAPGVDEQTAWERCRRNVLAVHARINKVASSESEEEESTSSSSSESSSSESLKNALVREGGKRRGDEKPMVAVLTADANGAHPLSQLLPSALGAVRNFRLVLVSMCADDGSEERRRFEDACDLVVDGHDRSPASIAASVSKLKPAILVDMCCHAGSMDLMEVALGVVERNPAAILVNGGLGTPFASGAPEFYRASLCDSIVAPRPFFFDSTSETRIQLPFTYFCADPLAYRSYDRAYDDKNELRRSDFGLKQDAVVLVCANRPHKVDPEVFDSWLEALVRLEAKGLDPQLWLLQPSKAGRARAKARAGPALADRLVFFDTTSRARHLRRLELADLALDTFCYGAHTLACDYAWAGVPLVAVDDPGQPWHRLVGVAVSRAALSVGPKNLRARCEAKSWGRSYVDAVVDVASDPDYRRDVKNALLHSNGRLGKKNAPPPPPTNTLAPLWDPRRWADGFERGLAALASPGIVPTDPIAVPPSLPRGSRSLVLASSEERVRHWDQHVSVALPELVRIDAVEGRDKKAVKKALADLDLSVASIFARDATAGQIACLASHALAWRDVADLVVGGDDDDSFVVVLEDDAAFPLGGDAFRAAVHGAVDDLRRRKKSCDLCYLYVYPNAWPTPPRELDASSRHPVGTVAGFRTWCLLAYLVTPRGARRLLDLIRTELRGEAYAPVDCLVADFAQRGLLDIRAVDARGFVDNAGQLDMRPPRPGKFASNLWNAPPWSDDDDDDDEPAS